MRLHEFKTALIQSIAAAAFVLCLASQPSTVNAIDLNIQSEEHYAQMLDGIRAAEYTRQNYLASDPNPRAIVSVVGLWAFAERNPQATPEQLSAFVIAYDSALANQIPGDAVLTSFGSVLSAVGGAAVDSTGQLQGMDTRVGDQVLELLGVSLPGLFDATESEKRMTQFDLASVQRLIQRRETMDALTAVLAGVTPDGQRPNRLDRVAAGYLTAQGLEPLLGSVNAGQTEINAAIQALPTYGEFISIRDTPGAHQSLEQQNFDSISEIQLQAEDLLQSIGTPEANTGQFLDALSLSLAASDPSDPNHAAALADLEARRQAIINRSRATARQRASVFARTLLLQQSNFPQVRRVAANTRSFAALQLQTNNTLAVIEQSVGIAGSLVGVFAGFKTGDPWGAVQSITDIVTGAFGLASLFDTGPSPEEQIFDQIVELREQVQDMSIQLNRRFDVVDRKLNQLFSVMTDSFAEIGNAIGTVQGTLDGVANSIARQRGALNRIEDALFGFAQAGFLFELTLQTNSVLNYFNTNGISLPYSGGSASFVEGSNFFFTYATQAATNALFAGALDDEPITVSLDNANDVLNDSETAIARYMNDLRRLPTDLTTSSGAVVGQLSNERIAAPAPWSQAAAAYVQLARENPWYFNFQYNIQLNSPGNPRIDTIIDEGEQIINFADTVQTDSHLFDALLFRAEQGSQAFQNAVFEQTDLDMPIGFSNGTDRVDPWGVLEQDVLPLLLPTTSFNVTWPGGSVNWFIPSGYPQKGQEIPVGDRLFGFPPNVFRVDISERNALSHIIEVGPTERPVIEMRLNKGTIVQNVTMALFQIRLGIDVPSGFGANRFIDFVIETRCFANCGAVGFNWNPLNFVPSAGFDPDNYFGFFDSGFGTSVTDFRSDLSLGDLEGRMYTTAAIGDGTSGYSVRLRVLEDRTLADTFSSQEQLLTDELAALRASLRESVITELVTVGSPIEQATRRLNNDAALLDAYLTIGMADAMTESELLRSAVRGEGSIAGVGFRSSDVEALILHDLDNDTGAVGGTPGAELTQLGNILDDRINALRIEIDEAANNAAPSFPYVEFILAELRKTRDQARALAIDETYTIDGAVVINEAEGLLSNDVGQPGQISNQELVIDLEFLNSPEAVQPENGTVVVAEDGSFTYTPDPGFNGIDRFTYRLKSAIPGIGQEAASLPADVVLRVGNFDDRIFSDGFEFGFQ